MRGAAAFALAALITPALAARTEDPKFVAARDASVALAVPALCPSLSIDHEALDAFMARAKLAESDLTGIYHAMTQAAVANFRKTAALDLAHACSDVEDRLGSDGSGLLTSEGDR